MPSCDALRVALETPSERGTIVVLHHPPVPAQTTAARRARTAEPGRPPRRVRDRGCAAHPRRALPPLAGRPGRRDPGRRRAGCREHRRPAALRRAPSAPSVGAGFALHRAGRRRPSRGSCSWRATSPDDGAVIYDLDAAAVDAHRRRRRPPALTRIPRHRALAPSRIQTDERRKRRLSRSFRLLFPVLATTVGDGSASVAGMAGYSGTPLWKKLGVKPGMRVLVTHADAGWSIPDAPDGVDWMPTTRRTTGRSTWCSPSTATAADYRRRTRRASASASSPPGSLWIAWPRKAAGHVSDLGDNVIREHRARTRGLVDVKVAAVDEDWSALKLVWRVDCRSR